jgi:hypothetical protein
VKQALGAPLRQIAENAGESGAVDRTPRARRVEVQTGFDAGTRA